MYDKWERKDNVCIALNYSKLKKNQKNMKNGKKNYEVGFESSQN